MVPCRRTANYYSAERGGDPDANLDDVKEPEVLKKHPGLLRIVLPGHRAYVEFRNLRIKELP